MSPLGSCTSKVCWRLPVPLISTLSKDCSWMRTGGKCSPPEAAGDESFRICWGKFLKLADKNNTWYMHECMQQKRCLGWSLELFHVWENTRNIFDVFPFHGQFHPLQVYNKPSVVQFYMAKCKVFAICKNTHTFFFWNDFGHDKLYTPWKFNKGYPWE